MNEQKKNLRGIMREALAEASTPLRMILSDRIARRILNMREFQEARTVAGYASLPTEAGTDTILQAAIDSGKKLLLPRVVPGVGEMTFLLVRDLRRDLVEEPPFGIRQPIPDRCEAVPLSECDLVLTPGLAFDRYGRRLGRGRGFYDRALAFLPSASPRIGLAFGDQMLDRVPTDERDVPVNCIVTDQNVYAYRQKEISCQNRDETERFGFLIGKSVGENKLIALNGPLGCGKTVFVQGVVDAWGGTVPATSPTYTLVNVYETARGTIYHIDLFRWDSARATAENVDELLDIFARPGLILVEWADRAREIIPVESPLIHGSSLDDHRRTWKVETFLQDDVVLIESLSSVGLRADGVVGTEAHATKERTQKDVKG